MPYSNASQFWSHLIPLTPISILFPIGFQGGGYHSRFSTKTLCVFLILLMSAMCPAHLIQHNLILLYEIST